MSIFRLTRRDLGLAASATAALSCAAVASASAQTTEGLDLVIRNGRVMDPETRFDEVANVGVRNGRIVAITRAALSGRRVIDATGHVVAPGFIDTHFHWPRPMGNKLALRDGRTTLMDLEIGTLGPRVADWYAAREGRNQVNYGCASAHELARALVLDGITTTDAPEALNHRGSSKTGWSITRPDLAQGNEILRTLDEGLAAGAVGIGSTLGYMRDGVSAREAFEIQKLAAQYGRQCGFHFRYTPGTDTSETNGIQELLANAAALGAPAIACHFNNPGYNLVHELLTRMRERGMNVWGETLPLCRRLDRAERRLPRTRRLGAPARLPVRGHDPGRADRRILHGGIARRDDPDVSRRASCWSTRCRNRPSWTGCGCPASPSPPTACRSCSTRSPGTRRSTSCRTATPVAPDALRRPCASAGRTASR